MCVRAITDTMPRMFNGTRVAAVMTAGVISCEPDTPLAEVAAIMAKRHVHAVYVFADDELWGLVSDLDLVAAARGRLDALTARDASVTPLLAVQSDDLLERAAQLLAENGVSHLAVLDASSRPVGVLSTLDVAHMIAVQSRERSKITSTLSCS
jgi:CBS domain-containing protein